MKLFQKIILPAKLDGELLDKNFIKVFWASDGSFLECYPDNTFIGWKKLLSGYYIKLSQDWVPGEVVHCQLQALPLQVRPVLQEELVDERLVQQWYECTTKREISEMQRTSSLSMPELAEQRHQQPRQQRSQQHQAQQYQQSSRISQKHRPKPSHIPDDRWMGVLPK
jgi:hypothetical protein